MKFKILNSHLFLWTYKSTLKKRFKLLKRRSNFKDPHFIKIVGRNNWLLSKNKKILFPLNLSKKEIKSIKLSDSGFSYLSGSISEDYIDVKIELKDSAGHVLEPTDKCILPDYRMPYKRDNFDRIVFTFSRKYFKRNSKYTLTIHANNDFISRVEMLD